MTLRMNWRMKVSTVVMALVFLSSVALAQAKHAAAEEATPDDAAIHDYLLTMDKAKKFAEVAKKIDAAAKADPVMAAEMKKLEETDAYNIQKAGLAEKSPHFAAFFRSNGTTARDFIFTPLVALSTAGAVAAEDAKQNPPAYVNPANIKFVREHKDELRKLNLFASSAD
ncbi:MAG: hypothetical protein ABR920_14565 [Terriglobales bacterium]